MTEKQFIIHNVISVSNKCYSEKKNIMVSTKKKYEAAQRFSTLIIIRNVC